MPINMTVTEPWRQAVVAWYAGDPKPDVPFLIEAMRVGLTSRVPGKPKDRVRLLTLAGFDDEDLVMAVPELDADLVLSVSRSIDPSTKVIFALHNEGLTPLEIAWKSFNSRPKIYYWLKRLNLIPHRHVRAELNARQRAQIVAAYNRGDRLVDIASGFNVSYDQVRYAVKKGTQ